MLPGERHTLGLGMFALALEDEGWEVELMDSDCEPAPLWLDEDPDRDDPARVAGWLDRELERAAPWLEALTGADTRVIVAQNGVEQVERVSPFVGDAEVLPAVVYCGSELIAPGHIRHYARGLLFVPEGGSAEAAAGGQTIDLSGAS